MSSASSSVLAPPPAVQRDLRELWLQVLRTLEPSIQRGQFVTWFRDTAVVGIEGDALVVGLPLPMCLQWHMEHYRDATIAAAHAADPSITTVLYKVDVSLKNDPSRTLNLLQIFPEPKRRKLPMRSEVKVADVVSHPFNSRYTMENFVVGSNSRLAHAVCQSVAVQPGGKYNPVFLYGGVGLGKTHLLQATGNAILKTNPHAAIVYTTTEAFVNQVIEAITQQKMEQFRRRYRVIDVLIIDDIQFLASKDRSQEEFFHTFNALYEDRKQLIISADRPPSELRLDDRLTSRFERGMVADLAPPDYETRLAILMEKAREHEMFLDVKVLQFIAEHTTRNVRELEGVLMQALAQFELEERMPTPKSIAEIMAKLRKDPLAEEEDVGFEREQRRQPTFQEIMEAVSAYYSISVQDMIGPSRVREVLVPRQIAMHLLKKHARMTYTRIGECFGDRDHTTVMHAMHKIERDIQGNAQLLREIRGLEREMKVGS
jgi:chromosomal replication initiator protein